MKRIFWIMSIAITLVLAVTACSPGATSTPIPTISLGGAESTASNQVKASAVVVPVQKARLSFVISGMVEEVTVKVGDQVEVGKELVKLDTTEQEFDIVAAQAALTSAEINAQMQRERRKRFDLTTFKFVSVSPPGEKILEADSRLEQSQFALEATKASLAQGTLLAPIAGTVVEVNISSGEYVQPAQVVIVLVNLENLQIETTDLSELNVAVVKIGQPATVYVEALDEEFQGRVTAISPISDTIGGDVVFKVTIELDEQLKELLWGMSADVEIDTQ